MDAENTSHGQLEETDSNSVPNSRTMIVVIMGATGSGKSKLAIDLATHFPIEIINADSMQVYKGLDVLTNKVPFDERKGVPHHLLGTISPNVEFTAKDFRDSAIRLINEIWARNCLPVIVGGTNYYIQALVSRFLLDDHAENLAKNCLPDIPDSDGANFLLGWLNENSEYTYSRLKDIDPVAADRIHPNDERKIKQFLSLYSRLGVLPSKLFQGDVMQDWGRADNLRYDCCFICVDASLPALDQYVNRRVDLMVSTGLLEEVRDIYNFDADYTRGFRQAIGVCEFEEFLRYSNGECLLPKSECLEVSRRNMLLEMDSSGKDPLKLVLEESIERMKLNTRRLVRRQRRRLSRLQMLFGWDINFIDVTSYLERASDNLWTTNVLEPSVNIIRTFLDKDVNFKITKPSSLEMKLTQRDLWTRYVCQACGNKELRGAHEWEQHRKGRCHRKRISKLRKLSNFSNASLDNPSD